MSKKLVYIIPGYSGLAGKKLDRTSKKLLSLFDAEKTDVQFVKIKWYKKNAEFGDYVKEFFKQTKKTKREVCVLGFSFGAMIAFLSATKLKPEHLILCSLSPYFSEDLKKLPPDWHKWWEKCFATSYSFNKIAPEIKARTYITVGDKEGKDSISRAKDAHKRIKGSKLFIAKGAKHNIAQKEYVSTLKQIIEKLEL